MRGLADLRVVFMGTPEFAVPCLDRLLEHGARIVAVVTGADKPAGRGQKVQASPVKLRALAAGLPILQPDNLRDPSFREALLRFPADLFVVVAFRILPAEIFHLPPLGTINVHASLLPKYRGAAPIQWAILRGERETGVTTFFIEEKMDAGDMILQRRTSIGEMETAGELHDRLKAIGAETLIETVKMIAAGDAPRRKQEGTPTPAPKITREMARIDWAQPAGEIVNLVRAMNPTPCAFTMHGDKLLRIYRAHEERGAMGEERKAKSEEREVQRGLRPGAILRANAARGELFVSTASGVIAIDELQAEGRKRMGTTDFLRGYDIVHEEILS
jgi:methionyl-tRNA formyltransferase